MTRQDVLATITEILQDVLDNPELTIEENSHFLDIPSWDSLAFVTLMAELENQCKVQLDMSAMQQAHTVGDVISLVLQEK